MLIYEFHMLPWLAELSTRYQQTISLANVPPIEWDQLQQLGIDTVWLMGVWKRSEEGIRIARTLPELQPEYKRALPDFEPSDVAGSPYCIADYTVDPQLGGEAGLAKARADLSSRGIKLLLDFVPNHTAPDHRWTTEHPEYYLQPLRPGRDPHFPPWTDTVQLNAFADEYRSAAVASLRRMAAMCDGVRCDMAMLLISNVFSRTWNLPAPAAEFWETVIPAVKQTRADFLFIAEAYWDLEPALLGEGFDYCYDKRLYDRLVHENAASVRAHLGADLKYQSRLIRFLENHDEPRAAATFAPDRHRAAAVATYSLPGATLIHHGQLHGAKRKLPVQLRRYPPDRTDPRDPDLYRFYKAVLTTRPTATNWTLLTTSNPSLLAWLWEGGPLVIVNFSDAMAEGRVHIPNLPDCILHDPHEGVTFERRGAEMAEPGLWVRLAPYASHYFELVVGG
ncbi:MAG: alpha-amylase [Bryobacterales bacterium]|nr:alpha-amylase [Bryobacterales bacterium]